MYNENYELLILNKNFPLHYIIISIIILALKLCMASSDNIVIKAFEHFQTL